MRQLYTYSLSDAARANRVRQIAAAFTAFRRANKRGRRIPRGLRNQVVAALHAGVCASALEKACGLSWSQVTRWRAAASANGSPAVAPRADVLSVVDAAAPAPSASAEGEVVVCVGAWRISVSRVAGC
jgi:hypothetical protein